MNQRSGRPRKTQRLVRTILHVVAGAVFLAIATVAAASAATEDQGPGFQSGRLQIAFVDGSGNLVRGPQFDVATAYPGMAPQQTVINLRNTGTLEETYTVSSCLHVSGPRSLDDVLQVSVKDRGTGEIVYRGRLSGLSFDGTSSLAPRRSASYVLSITWPETGANDNAYQGRALEFGLRAEAEPAAA